MELTNHLRVGVPIDEAWGLLTDIERIAPCMPGAQLQEIEGDEYRGIVKVKVGPITTQYKGRATFVERDEANYRAVLRAVGRETRGQGNASATVRATLTPDGDGTAVSVVTDLAVTGRVAQFGRGVLADVSAKLLGQFVDCLESTVLAGVPGPETVSSPSGDAAGTTPLRTPPGPPSETGAEVRPAPSATARTAPAAVPDVRRINAPEPEPVDLLGTAGRPVAKRVGAIVAAVTFLWLLRRLMRLM